jgi:hypothetical protein
MMADGISSELKHDAILTGITFLLGGNKTTQAKFLEFMMQDPQNLIILSTKGLIEENFTIAKKAMERFNRHMEI